MEKPYAGKAKIKEGINNLIIEIPPKRNYFIIAFLSFWLCGWLMGELFALGALTGLFNEMGGAGMFLFVWLAGWTLGGLFAIRTWLYMVAGKEVLTFERGILHVTKKMALFHKPKTYSLKDAENFAVNTADSANDFWSGRQNQLFNLGSFGTLKFDYGLKTIKIAGGIDEAEGRYILKKLIDKGFVKA